MLHFLLRAQHQVIDDCDGVDVDDVEMLLLLMMMMMAMVVMMFSRVGETFHASQPSITVDGFTDPSQGDRCSSNGDNVDARQRKGWCWCLGTKTAVCQLHLSREGAMTGPLLKWRNGRKRKRRSVRIKICWKGISRSGSKKGPSKAQRKVKVPILETFPKEDEGCFRGHVCF